MDGRLNPWNRWSWALVLAATSASEAAAQSPIPPASPPGAPASPVCHRRGRLHRMFHHTAHTLEDDFIGRPDTFIEPPLGFYVNQQFAVQVAKADTHRFTVYQSDFLPGSDRFSPIGASRFNLMFNRLAGWPGPIFVEWTPDQPELAESRRRAILATLAAAGRPMPAERVVIGPSPYPGAMGVDAVNNIGNTIQRGANGSIGYSPPPNFTASMGVR